MPKPCVPCSVDGCNNQAGINSAIGLPVGSPNLPYCFKHYQNLRRHGSVNAPPRRTAGTCFIDGCNRKHEARGLCPFHYLRWVKFGDPLREPPEGESLRFLKDVALNSESDDCISWPFFRDKNGRGRISIKGRRSLLVHREVCTLAHGNAPSPKLHAAHSCGNGHEGCVNPKHLRWATAKENSEDAIRHGSIARGTRLPHCRLSENAVREIRELSKTTKSQKEIAKTFKVDRSHISDIVNRKRWSWLSD